MAASFASELGNPKKNVPIALVSSVLIVLVIYLLLQVSFIAAVPTHMIENGWGALSFTSPLAQLAGIFGLNAMIVILYADAMISPSGTGILYLGGSTRMLNEMAKSKQMPEYFTRVDPVAKVSRTSLIFTLICSILLIFFFRNWQMIASLTTTFILVACLALPISYAKLRADKEDPLPVSYLPFSQLISLIVFLFLSYLLMISGILYLAFALGLHLGFFFIYAYVDTKHNFKNSLKVFASSWTVFAYLVFQLIAGAVFEHLNISVMFYIAFFSISTVFYVLMIKQKNYTTK
jgi:amino acid transporter